MTTEKRSIEHDSLHFNVSTIIVDIEGTTTSINFVKETLFPYVRENLKGYVESNWSDKEFQEDVGLLKEQAAKDLEDKLEGAVEIPDGDDEKMKASVISYVTWQMDNDRKTKALKQLQGHIWRSGYSSGKLIGHIYDEVKDCLQTWTEAGKKIYVYSSGSVEAQKLLFGSTKEGDLLSMFSGYFDTAVGAKTESASYGKILEQLKESGHVSGPKDALFLTDVPNEAKAASEAGLEAVIVVREGNAPLPEGTKDTFPVINSFCDLIFEGNSKRRKLSSDETVTENSATAEKNTAEEAEKDVEMDECPPSDSCTSKMAVDKQSEESVENTKGSTDSSGDTKIESSSLVKENIEKSEKVDKEILEVEESKNAKENPLVAEKTDGVLNGVKAEPAVAKNSDVEKMEEEEIKSVEKESEGIKKEISNDIENSKTEKDDEAKDTTVEENLKEAAKVENPVDNGTVEKENGVDESKMETKDTAVDKKELLNDEVKDKENGSKEAVEEDKTKNVDEKASDEISTNKDTPKEETEIGGKPDVKTLEEKSNCEVKTNDKKEADGDEKISENTTEETDKESQNCTKSDKVDVESINDNKNEAVKIKENDNSTVIDVKEKKIENNKMEVEGKSDTKTDNDDMKAELNSKDCEKLENGESPKETDIEKTDPIVKTNGTHEENCKNGIDEDKKEIAEEKVIKEKTIEKSIESNGVETAEKI